MSERVMPGMPERPELDALIRKAVASHAALSPVDRAIADVQQRHSFVRGNVGMDVEWTDAHHRALDADPAAVLMNEVIALRAENARLREEVGNAAWHAIDAALSSRLNERLTALSLRPERTGK